MLALRPGDPDVVAKARDMVERQSAQMTRLVDDLLDASRIARGKVTLQRERVGKRFLFRLDPGADVLVKTRYDAFLDHDRCHQREIVDDPIETVGIVTDTESRCCEPLRRGELVCDEDPVKS